MNNVYREILKIVENCRIIHDDNTGLTVETDLDIHRKYQMILETDIKKKRYEQGKLKQEIKLLAIHS